MDQPIPCEGCLVTWPQAPGGDRFWRVRRVIQGPKGLSASLQSLRQEKNGLVVDVERLEPVIRENTWVLHSPSIGHGEGLGIGRVIARRHEGRWTQCLVEFVEQADRRWVPWQRLAMAFPPEFLYRHQMLGQETEAERFRLRALADGLRFWNENTGALSRFDIDPLPHQIQLVHHILSSGNYNWLIADDVGLGKTIEAGLLIAALRQREVANRILIVVPAGLVRQWQEDLRIKFGLDDFLIYGSDFSISDAAHWRLYPRVIASMDRIKAEGHLDRLLEADVWDLVVFDEAHRLTRQEQGRKYVKSDRFRMAEKLRPHARYFLMLSATPHQGRHDQFSALLELLRPELTTALQQPEIPPGILRQMVFRNRKPEVTDTEGRLLFSGQISRMIPVDSTPELRELESQLASYLREGNAVAQSGGTQSRAVGFVMMVYRKLAASSLFALREALARRLARLKNQSVALPAVFKDAEDERFEGELEEIEVANSPATEFFYGEIARLETLVEIASEALNEDLKLNAFLDRIISDVLAGNPDEKVLIFSEYRGTQDYLRAALSRRFGEDKVSLINGSMAVEERVSAIRHFENEGQFLLSTEAGGEGLNLQRKCHIMVNYDLPWNPMRLAQRIGRLYRYGQRKQVVTFNLQATGSADELIVAKMYDRLVEVARDMAEVESAPAEVLVSDIVGQLATLLDVQEILRSAREVRAQETSQNLEEALRSARGAAEMEREIFRHAAAFDPSAMGDVLQLDLLHLQSFVLGMVRLLGGTYSLSRKHGEGVFLIELPEPLGKRGTTGARSFWATFDRRNASSDDSVDLLHMEHPLVKRLVDMAQGQDFGGLAAKIKWRGGPEEIAIALLRWQDETGRRLKTELVHVSRKGPGLCSDPKALGSWLLIPQPLLEPGPPSGQAAAAEFAASAGEWMQKQLTARSSADMLPELVQWTSFGKVLADSAALPTDKENGTSSL